MTNIETIKQKIIQLDAGSFQNLCDAYLSKTGFPNIVSLGSEAGTRKTTRGTPDTYFNTDDGNYIFVEYTTQKKSLFTKIKSDIYKCLDVSMTGVSHEKISEIIYCHNSSNITPAQDTELKKVCSKSKIKLTLIGIDKLSMDLYLNHHIILRDFLGISMSTGQIQVLDDFIQDYNSNQMAAPIDTDFLLRENEIENIDKAFENTNIVVLNGSSGTGKTRLALHYAKIHSEQHSETLYCIHSNAIPIFEDLKLFIDKPGNYFLFVDDANQLSGLQHVLRYANMKSEGYHVNILITARDYALQKVIQDIQTISSFKTINITTFKDEEIKELLESILGITNSAYLKRIIQIAEGNARIAILAGKVACKSNNLNSINDVSQLYEAYYGSLIEGENLFEDKKICIVAGILAFLSVIHLDHSNLLKPILKLNKISNDEFIDNVHKLHKLEIIDIYNDKAVKFSEQCLSNYLLKYVFYDKKFISLSNMIKYSFQNYKEKTIYSTNTLLSIFRNDELYKYVKSEVKKIWNELSKENAPYFFEFVRVFFRINPTEALLIVQEKIELEPKVVLAINDLDINKGKNYQNVSNEIIEILVGFSDMKDFPTALDLFFNFYLKRPDLYIEFYHAINIYFGIRKDSREIGYYTQITLFEKFVEHSNNWEDPYITLLFLDIAEVFLKLHFTPTEASRNNSFTIYQIPLEISRGVKKYRKFIWKNLNELCGKGINKDKIWSILNSYGKTIEEINVPVIEYDLNFINAILNAYFTPDELKNCILADYLQNIFNKMNIPTHSYFSAYSKNEQIQLYHLLKGSKQSNKKSCKERKIVKKDTLEEYVTHCNLMTFKKLIDICYFINKSNNHEWEIGDGLRIAFEIFRKNESDYINAVNYYIQKNTPLNLNPSIIIKNLFNMLSDLKILEIINKYNFSEKNAWLYAYYCELPEKFISDFHLKGLLTFLSDDSDKDLKSSSYRDIEFLKKYILIDENIFTKGIKIIFEKRKYSPFIVDIYFNLLFNEYLNSPQIVIVNFIEDLSLLEGIYCEICLNHNNGDYDGKFLKAIYLENPTILNKYISHLIEKANDPYSDYSEKGRCFFELDNYIEIYNKIFSDLMEKCKYPSLSIPHYLESILFPIQNESKLLLKQDKWLKECISLHSKDKIKMYCIFSIIAKLPLERKKIYYELFMEINHSFEDFTNIPLTPSMWSWSGSAVPMYSNWINFFKSLLPFFVGIKWIRHKKYIEDEIEYMNKQIESEQIEEIIRG